MKKAKYVSLALLAVLLVFALAIPFSNSTGGGGGYQGGGGGFTGGSGGLFYYHVFPICVNFTSGSGRYSSYGTLYNTVSELRKAYDLNPLYAAGYNGTGQTVVIIDAFGNPWIYSDLLNFITWQNSHGANLPWTTNATIASHLHIYYPRGYVPFNYSNADEVGWSVEIDLDIDMVHAIAPGANIALVISPSDSDITMYETVTWAVVNHLGSVISQSWGDPEWDIVESVPGWQAYLGENHGVYMLAAQEGITVFASAGDWGAMNFNPLMYNSPLYPASDPYVTAVGGTNLFMHCNAGYSEGTGNWTNRPSPCTGASYSYEIAGNDYEAMTADGYPAPYDMVTTGGAMSACFPLPSWQRGITMTYANGKSFTPTMRCVSDVSYDSGVYGGLGAVYIGAYAGYYIVGGTSAGSPFWSALTAIADQYAGHSIGYINPQLYADMATLYSTGAFHDITMGDNTYPTGNTVIGFEATKGWDAPTGIGSPDAAKLVPELKGF
jgi:subtilase family serine protease